VVIGLVPSGGEKFRCIDELDPFRLRSGDPVGVPLIEPRRDED
jgi:hypothetical protein